MVISSLRGGLGNQMFQYAAGRALTLRSGVPLKLDLSWYDCFAESDTPRSFMLGVFPGIRATIATRRECKQLMYIRRGPLAFLLRRPRPDAASHIREPHYTYWSGFYTLDAPLYLSGYWQNERYFAAYADVIRQDFTFPELPSEEAKDMARRILAVPQSVSVHVRRGDYVSNSAAAAIHGLCSPEYYSAALDAVTAQTSAVPELFLFSDDPVWVREHFATHGLPITVLDFPSHNNAPWHDMHLMSLCKHHIIANSSFSWWGAWLGECGLVVAPKRWFQAEDMKNSSPVPSRWVRV